MANYPAESATSLGITPTVRAAALTPGDTIPVGSLVRVRNGSASSVNVTLVTDSVVDGNLAVDDRVIAVGAGVNKYIRVTDFYRNADGFAHIFFSAITTVDYEVIL